MTSELPPEIEAALAAQAAAGISGRPNGARVSGARGRETCPTRSRFRTRSWVGRASTPLAA